MVLQSCTDNLLKELRDSHICAVTVFLVVLWLSWKQSFQKTDLTVGRIHKDWLIKLSTFLVHVFHACISLLFPSLQEFYVCLFFFLEGGRRPVQRIAIFSPSINSFALFLLLSASNLRYLALAPCSRNKWRYVLIAIHSSCRGLCVLMTVCWKS